jgi:signal transduction histidine kinase
MIAQIDYYSTNKYDDFVVDELRNQFAIEASGIGVWDWNLVTNEVFYSAESLKILEINGNESSNFGSPENWDDLVHPEDKELYFKNIQLHFEGKTEHYETCHRVLCNGKYKWILDKGKVVQRDENGNPVRIIGTHTDISDQKEKEQILLEALKVVNNQNNRLLNFAHIVAHNLRNQSGNISSLVNLKEADMVDDEEFFSYISKVSKELSSTIENLVDLVRVQNDVNDDKEKLGVNNYLGKVLNILEDNIQKNKITVVNKIDKNFSVNFNKSYLESILLNLTSNAIKYSDRNKEAFIEYTQEVIDGYSVLVVKDNGIGIDLEKHKDEVFGLYKTFHTNENSTGIGLHITKNQIESMGGKIEVESKVGEGTTFKVYFA